VCTALTGEDGLQIRELADRPLEAGEIRIAVRAASGGAGSSPGRRWRSQAPPGVRLAAVQVARAAGASTVIAIAGGAAKCDLARRPPPTTSAAAGAVSWT
jgi:NADPH:quinone reductase-like Zn-dependent oxidoreductase